VENQKDFVINTRHVTYSAKTQSLEWIGLAPKKEKMISGLERSDQKNIKGKKKEKTRAEVTYDKPAHLSGITTPNQKKKNPTKKTLKT